MCQNRAWKHVKILSILHNLWNIKGMSVIRFRRFHYSLYIIVSWFYFEDNCVIQSYHIMLQFDNILLTISCFIMMDFENKLFVCCFTISWSGLSAPLWHGSLCRICDIYKQFVEEGGQGLHISVSSSPSFQHHLKIYYLLMPVFATDLQCSRSFAAASHVIVSIPATFMSRLN